MGSGKERRRECCVPCPAALCIRTCQTAEKEDDPRFLRPTYLTFFSGISRNTCARPIGHLSGIDFFFLRMVLSVSLWRNIGMSGTLISCLFFLSFLSTTTTDCVSLLFLVLLCCDKLRSGV